MSEGIINLYNRTVAPEDVAVGVTSLYSKGGLLYSKNSSGSGVLVSGGVDGWTPVVDSWSYVSGSTISVPAGAASLYAVGDKIKFTQTTVKYFYITAVADTVLTVTGGIDYTVVDAAISAVSYSHQSSPVGFPQWFAYTPTFEGFSSAPASSVSRFCIKGREVTVTHNEPNLGTSNATNFTISAPVPHNGTTVFWSNSPVAYNNTTFTTGVVLDIGTFNDKFRASLPSFANWTNSGSKGASFVVMYEI